jgi:hypothetical protein
LQVEVPYWNRLFKTADEDSGAINSYTHSALGDIRIKATYDGFSPDLSTGVTLGMKLPTGDNTYPNFDPDTEIGSGSTDVLLGAYHIGSITADGSWRYFVQAQYDWVVAHDNAYIPGNEFTAVLGANYKGWNLGPGAHLTPYLQLSWDYRGHDGGPSGHPDESGYDRLVVTPGLQLNVHHWSAFLDVGFPAWVNVTGNQLTAFPLYQLNVSYHF